jgi:serine/threonine protein kinase
VKVIAKGSHSITPECYRNEVSLLHKLTNGPDTNPNIIRLIIPKCIESEKNYYLVTEYCNNCTLYDLMETRRQERRRFTLWEFIQLALDLVSGYFALKNRGIMHNDLKPQNIFIKDKVFKIGDFGLALKLSSTHGAVPCGTILYAAPEKLNRHAHRTDVDHKADIYALGLILYEVLYGCHPYWEKQEFENFRRQTYDRMAKEGSLRKYSEK